VIGYMNLLMVAAVALVALGPPEPATIRYSRYWPPLGGTNCSSFGDGQCVSRMASGERWQDWTGRACACPPEYPFWTVIELNGKQWVCLDRGGKVRGSWIDFLEQHSQYGYGTEVDVTVSLPELEVPALDHLSTSIVDHTNTDDNSGPGLEVLRLNRVSQASKCNIQPSAYKDADENCNIALNCRDRNPELILYKALNTVEVSKDERALEDPVNSNHRQCVLNSKHEYCLK